MKRCESMKNAVLICDDNIAVHKSISSYLEEDGIKVLSAFDGDTAIELSKSHHIDLIILDVMMPKKNGFDVCREIRKRSEVPILMLSAKDSEIDRILGLEIGADDYVTKPFSPREISIRVQKLLRRINTPHEPQKMSYAELVVYPERYEAFVNDKELDLTPKEVSLLAYLVYNAGRVLSREAILNSVWGYDYTGDTRTVDTHIKRLRQKLPSENVHFTIRSIYGIGYKLEEVHE